MVEYERELGEDSMLPGLVTTTGSPGEVLLVIEDLPLETTTISDLPPVVFEELPEHLREGLGDLVLADAPDVIKPRVRELLPELPRNLLGQLEQNVIDGSIYVQVRIDDGEEPRLRLLQEPEKHPDSSPVIRGTCDTWGQIIEGRPALSAILGGDLRVEGDLQSLLQYSSILQLLGDVAADVETTHIFASPDTTFPEFVLDSMVRQPRTVQKMVQRQATATLSLFSPF